MKKMEIRQTKILELLTERKKVDVNEFSQLLKVSQVTIRKDLDLLEKKRAYHKGSWICDIEWSR